MFGFIGGGASLGGITGSGIAGRTRRHRHEQPAPRRGCAPRDLRRDRLGDREAGEAQRGRSFGASNEEKGVSPREAFALLIESKHFQIIALVISFAAIGAGIVEQQVNMAVAAAIPGKDGRTAFLANVIFYSSIAGFIIQMTLTSRIHRLLGIGFALLLLPFTLGGTGVLMLAVPLLWAQRPRASSTPRSATPSTRRRARSSSCRCRRR